MKHSLPDANGSGAAQKSAGDIVVEALRAEGVAAIFGIVGSHVVGIYEALRQAPDIRAVSARHEGAASYMAAGMARLTGEVGVAIVTAGPGVLNALNGVAQAEFSAEPVVIIAGG
ncbi:MAG TPA: thiamine pyrophosphate-binding protein, partial [Amphiplicatus sp.]|nr:thiamine pyrophosphate-binding protein [Amphiplicatus sp.]